MIVRNVGFNVTKDQLKSRFSDYGEVVDVHLPPSKRTSTDLPNGKRLQIPPHAGYAFVEFDTREQAQQAITGVNDSRVGGRRVAVDFAYDIRLYKAACRKSATKTDATETPSKPADKDEDMKEEESMPEPEKSLKRPSVAETPVNAKKSKTEEVVSLDDADTRKLFLINIPYDADRSAIVSGLCEFGKIKEKSDIESVLLVKDKEGKFLGKAFVVFKQVDGAEKVLQLEKSSLPEMFGDMYKNKDGRLATAPIEGVGCLVNGRRIGIMKALTRAQVEVEKQKKEQESNPKNPKLINRMNLELINAGWINEQHESWKQLDARERNIRIASNEERKIKLKNPNYVINTKRLTVKNVPKHFENGDLMKVVVASMKLTGPGKLKRGGILKVAIVKDKVPIVDHTNMQVKKAEDWNLEMEDSGDELLPAANGAPQDKVKMKKKSRGFAFVDFNSTENALRCLNALNNVPGGFGDGTGTRRPIVEFSFDDVRKLQIQKARLDKTGGKEVHVVSVKKNKRLGRGQKQRLKRRLAKDKCPVS